jgi:type VI secretion system secreted protein Hcp
MKSATLATLATLVILTCNPVYAATEMFMRISDIPGESADPQYPGWIELRDWKISIHNTNQVNHESSGKKPGIGDITITKDVDSTTTLLHEQCCNGKHYQEAELVVRKAGQPGSEYVLIKIQDLVITSVSTGGSGEEDRLTENVTLNFSKFETDYQPQLPEGRPPVGYGWDIKKGKE